MRLSWFTSLRAGRRKGKRQRLKAAPLRVRQLERRRVLDAAVSSVVVSTVIVADAGQTAPAATTTNATDAPPIVPPVANNANETALTASPGEGLANSPPVFNPATNRQVNEGQELDLSGAGGAPPLATFTDPDAADSHTATVDWGDGSPVQNATVIAEAEGGKIGGKHFYADDGTYTVKVTVDDGNGGSASQTFDVLVNNVQPVLIAAANQTINEGQLLDLSNSGGAPALGLFLDPGFDNPLNPNAPVLPDIADPLHESFTYDVDWGDGRDAITGASVADINGGPGVLTVGTISGTHTYADDGTYTVTVTVHDDNGGSASRSFKVTVNNVPPVLIAAANQTINEGQLLDLSNSGGAPALGLFLDPGFDNPLNPNAAVPPNITDPLHESFTYDVDWGDGRDAITGALVADINGGPGILTVGTISGTHTYADDGAYTVTVTVHDDNGGSASSQFKVKVNNVQPVLIAAANQTINEGQLLDLSNSGGAPALGLFLDPGFDNPLNPNAPVLPDIADPLHESFTYDVDWGDGRDAITGASVADINGGPGVLTVGTISGTHTYADDGTYTVTVTVHDDNGGSKSATFTVIVSNMPPTVVTPNGNQSILEGGKVEFANLATFTDPGFDNLLNPNSAVPPNITDPLHESFTYDIDWGDGRDPITGAPIADVNGGPGTPSSGTIGGSHTYADDGTYTVKVTVHDDNGGSHFATFTVTVGNVVPTVVAPNGNQSILEGGTISFADLATFTDPGFDNPLNPNGPVPPNITDPLHESFTYDIDWGDGRDAITGASIADVNGGPGIPSSGTIGGSHTYADDGTYTVTVTVHDDNGGVTSAQFTVTVNNVAPTVVTPNGNQTILEGGTVSFANLATFTDPGFDNPLNPNGPVPPNITDPLHESFTYDINWGDGRDAVTGASISDINGGPGTLSSGTIAGSHTYADDGTYTVTVTVHDDNGGVTSAQFTVTVGNVAPTVATPNGDQTILEGSTVSFANLATFTDPGFDNPLNPNGPVPPNITDPLHESFTYDINWGDGRDAITGASIADVNGGPGTPSSGTIGGSHTYADDGTYTVTVTVHDDNGGVTLAQFTVTVNNVAPSVVTPNGNQTILEGGTVSFANLATFTDPGFDNPLNPNAAVPPNITDPLHETFTYDINWGDGRDAIIGASIADINGAPGTPSSGTIAGSHIYADDGIYTVTVTVHDDNGGVTSAQFTVTVNNVVPSITGPINNLNVNEGQAFVLSNLGGATLNLGLGITDPGFDNPNNPNPASPEIADPTHETFTGVSINWGDGTATGALAIVNRTTDLIDGPTTALLQHTPHVYADDGDYTVTITAFDDNGGPLTPQTITIHVHNMTPTIGFADITSQQPAGSLPLGPQITTPVPAATTIHIDETGTVTFKAAFTDPGFDNPSNPNAAVPPSITDPLHESFKYHINWGDGRETIASASIADINGGPGVLSNATIVAGIHTYADDGTYTVTIRLADDNMGAFTDASKFISGVVADFGENTGGDYVETQFTVVVKNIAPSLVGGIAGTQVTSQGFTTINVSFSDPGFDNTANLNAPAPPTITDTLHESFTHVIDWGDGTVDGVHTYTDASSHDVTITQTGPSGTQTFTMPGIGAAGKALTLVSSQDINNPGAAQPFTYVVDWGDGNVQTISLMLKAPGAPTVNGLTVVGSLIRTSGNVGVATTGSFGITHQFLAPPDPLNPTNNIKITVSVVDDNNDSVSDFVTITNPGIATFNVAIDTTPDVPRLALAEETPPPVFLDQQSAVPTSVPPSLLIGARLEETTAADRYLELVVVSPDGIETDRYRLSDEALSDLRGLFATLPDNRYKIYLVRTGSYSRRLVIDVFVRSGRVIDPSDKSEGTRDRPPMAEITQQINDQNKNVQQDNLQPIGAPQQQAVPLQDNPLLKRIPDEKAGAANQPDLPANGPADGAAPTPNQELSDTRPLRSRASMRWALPLAGLGLVASRESWSERLGTALETADDAAWERLRRAGRIGKSFRKSPARSGKAVCGAEQPS